LIADDGVSIQHAIYGYGDVLMMLEEDFYGEDVNRAATESLRVSIRAVR